MTFISLLAKEVANKTFGEYLIIKCTQTDFMTPDRISFYSATREDKGAEVATHEFNEEAVDAIKKVLYNARFA